MKKTSFLRTTFLFLRSVLFSLIFFATVTPYSFLCVIGFLFPLRVRYAMVVGWTYFIIWSLKTICGIDYKIDGLENIPKDRAGIVLSKHQSTWETFIIPVFFNQAAIILKKELLWIPFFGWGLAAIEPIAIDRSKKSSAMEQILKKGKEFLSRGRWILVFPEGTRIPFGQVGTYRLGGARLATAAEAPVIPVAHNAGRYWPKKKFIKQPGTIRMVIGPVIETKNRSAEDVMKETKDWIEGTIEKINLEK